MNSKSRRCSHCKKKCPSETMLSSNLRAFCSMDCLRAFTESDKGRKAIKKAVTRQNREDRARVLEKHKTRSEWIREAQKAFNAYVRWRDRNEPCISCGRYVDNDVVGGNWDAGHYRSVGSAPHLRFHLWNCHKQCVKCNRYLSGNVANYRVGLVWKWGQTKVEELEVLQSTQKIDINYAKRVKSIFTRLLKHRQKLRGIR